MEEVKAYRTSDGRLHDEKHDALLHETDVQMRAAIGDFVDQYAFSAMTTGDVVDMLLERYHELESMMRRARSHEYIESDKGGSCL